jgi:outer membrane immunogenic protein
MQVSLTRVTIAALAVCGSQASAGGLGEAISDNTVPAPVNAPMVALPAQSWTGGYVGASLAYMASKAVYCQGFEEDAYDCNDPADGLPEPAPEGAMIGLTGGYDWQRGSIVYGVAGDLLFGDLQDSVDSSSDPSYGCGLGCGLDVTGTAMLRGRVGYASGNFLPYVTAGIAVTQATVFEGDAASKDGTFNNVVVGLGVEYMVSETISAGFDISHLLEGDEPIINDDFCTDCGATAFSATMARITLAYRF